MEKLRCCRCGHEWWPKTPNRPGVCPRCKSYDWDKPREGKPATKPDGMSHDQLAGLIREHGVRRMAEAVNNPVVMLGEGWDLTRWHIGQIPGAVMFYRTDRPYDSNPISGEEDTASATITDETSIMCINDRTDKRDEWVKALEGERPVLVIMAPGGRVQEDK